MATEPTRNGRHQATPGGTQQGRRRADWLAAWHLSRGAMVKDTAALVGVNKRTILRWLKRPEFLAKVTEMRALLLRRGRGLLASGLDLGLARLQELAKSDDERIACRAATALARI